MIANNIKSLCVNWPFASLVTTLSSAHFLLFFQSSAHFLGYSSFSIDLVVPSYFQIMNRIFIVSSSFYLYLQLLLLCDRRLMPHRQRRPESYSSPSLKGKCIYVLDSHLYHLLHLYLWWSVDCRWFVTGMIIRNVTLYIVLKPV